MKNQNEQKPREEMIEEAADEFFNNKCDVHSDDADLAFKNFKAGWKAADANPIQTPSSRYIMKNGDYVELTEAGSLLNGTHKATREHYFSAIANDRNPVQTSEGPYWHLEEGPKGLAYKAYEVPRGNYKISGSFSGLTGVRMDFERMATPEEALALDKANSAQASEPNGEEITTAYLCLDILKPLDIVGKPNTLVDLAKRAMERIQQLEGELKIALLPGKTLHIISAHQKLFEAYKFEELRFLQDNLRLVKELAELRGKVK